MSIFFVSTYLYTTNARTDSFYTTSCCWGKFLLL